MSDFFEIKKQGSSIKIEIIAGITTFLSMIYIIAVNPAILSATGMPASGVVTATVLVSAFSSIAMGIWAKSPIAIAPGMGLNAFFTFGVVLGMKVPWETALGAVFWAGVIFLILSILNIRTAIVKAIPKQLRMAIAGGIGLFITFIGFVNSGFIVKSEATLVQFGGLTPVTLTFIIGLIFTVFLSYKKIKGALIWGIIATTILYIPVGRLWGAEAFAKATESASIVNFSGIFSKPDFSLIFKLDFIGALKFSIIPVIFAFLFADLFDSVSCFIGVAEAADLVDEDGEPLHIKECMTVDAISTSISGLFGSSPGTSYIESAAGVEEGGRTGLTAVVCGTLFIPFLFLSPLISVVPIAATSPALVLVGLYMMKPISQIKWREIDNALPAFLALILIPLTYSITHGIIWSFLAWTILKLVLGKFKEISIPLIIIDILAIFALIIGH